MGEIEAAGGAKDGERLQPQVRRRDGPQAGARGEAGEGGHARDARERAGRSEDGEGGWWDAAELEVGGEDHVVR